MRTLFPRAPFPRAPFPQAPSRLAPHRAVMPTEGFVCDGPVVAPRARRLGAAISDVRTPPIGRPLRYWTGEVADLRATRVAVLGTDRMVGKGTTSRLLVAALRETGTSAEMIHTGPTGWMQGSRYGIMLDALPSDFIAGELEGAMLACAAGPDPDVMVLEGRSALRNPADSGAGSHGILIAGDAHGIVLQHSPARIYFHGLEDRGYRIPDIHDEVSLLERFDRPVCAVTINTQGMDPASVDAECARLEGRLGRPVVAPLEHGLERVVDAIQNMPFRACSRPEDEKALIGISRGLHVRPRIW